MNPYVQYMYSYPHKTAYRTLQGVSLREYASRLSGTGHGLYLHIPFCQTKCGYCNLFSVTGQGSEEIDHYLDAVERQAGQYQDILSSFGSEFSSCTIGGGTPLLLSEIQMERMFTMLNYRFSFSKSREFVIETAPNQTTDEKLALLKDAGVTRVSMGIQSLQDEELKILGRHHCAEKARESLALLKSFDFPCVNVDLIYGIPGQTVDSLMRSLEDILSFEPEEIFLYPLYVKHGAKMEKSMGDGMVLDADMALIQYREASSFLRAQGYCQDSMRRFVRRRDMAVREFSDCGFGTSLALGCGGRSYLGNLHFCTPYAITRKDCMSQIEAFESTVDFDNIAHGIFLSEEEEKRRYVIRHLLIAPGLDLQRYGREFGSSVLEDFPLILQWMRQGWVKRDSYLCLTDEGLALSDYLGPQLMSDEVSLKIREWEAVHDRKNDSVPGKSEIM